jgi:glutathione synthase/RimK-type ligase-like ATP-grasp enzyme
MSLDIAILNAGAGAWAFEEHALRLSRLLGIEVRAEAAEYAYLLGWDGPGPPPCRELFIPYASLQIAADKRLQARLFREHGVATPETHLVESREALAAFLTERPDREWALKYPTGCGASGHRFFHTETRIPDDWPVPFVVQEFIRMPEPEVYRLYGAGGELFGWNVRRFPPGTRSSPWVAHVRGAGYAAPGAAPPEAEAQARRALEATGLLASFGCVDLLRSPEGRWLVLEVGTDGRFNHVDRDLGLPEIEAEVDARLARSFQRWRELGTPI